ncbi:hypothetical protein OC842_002963 [Tilletia horrida]|uniref:Zn(2)-C6 fungal-type domain-containing protein n=1 Tax=Tilletia horrida TaxID=155126 RepID=A0AAN6JKV0_9BASI|nr:hypothetical protein OC842_002963 [Tilletia horrida]
MDPPPPPPPALDSASGMDADLDMRAAGPSSAPAPAPGPASTEAPTAATAAAATAAADGDPPRKPKRIQNVSCDQCRTRKVRCDRAPKIAEWRAANQHLPQARDLAYRPGTDVVWCSLCDEHGIKCTLNIKPPKRRVGKRLAALKAQSSAGGDAAAAAAPTRDEEEEGQSSGSEHQQHNDSGNNHAERFTVLYAGTKRKRSNQTSGTTLDQLDPDLSIRAPSNFATLSADPSFLPLPAVRAAEHALADSPPSMAPNLPSPPMLNTATARGQQMYSAALLPPQTGLFGVPRLTKAVLDACVIGYFSGPCVSPGIVRYEEILPRYRTYFRNQWAQQLNVRGGPSVRDSGAGASFGIAAGPSAAAGLFDGPAGDNMPLPNSQQYTANERALLAGRDIIPLPELLIVAMALSGCGQLDKELYPFKLLLQRDLAQCWKALAFDYLHTVDLGMDFSELGMDARVDCHEAQDALDAMIIVAAQDFDFMQSEAEVALRKFHHRTWAFPRDLQGQKALRQEHLRHQRALLFNIRSTTLEGTLRFAQNMGINRNPLNALASSSSGGVQNPLSLISRIQRTREWWSIFASDAFESLARRRPLLIGDHDFDVPLPAFRIGPGGDGMIITGFGKAGLPNVLPEPDSTPVAAPIPAAQNDAPSQSNGSKPAPYRPYRPTPPTTFDVKYVNSLFGLVYLARGLSRRFVSVRVQGQGVNVLDALNAIELLERFYRGIPDELRWETQDAKLLGILAELYPPETAGRAAAATATASASASAAQHGGAGPSPRAEPSPAGTSPDQSASAAGSGSAPSAVRRRRVPNSLRATSKAFRDGIQSLFLESLLLGVVVSMGSAVQDFGFRPPFSAASTSGSAPSASSLASSTMRGATTDESDPLAVMEAMLSGQLRENPFYRVNQDSESSEPRFLQTRPQVQGQGKGLNASGSNGGPAQSTSALPSSSTSAFSFEARALALQQRSMEDITVARLYTLMLRFFFRAAKIYREGAEHGFLSARHNTFGSIAAVFGLWGVKHVNTLIKAEEQAGGGRGAANGDEDGDGYGAGMFSTSTAPDEPLPSAQKYPFTGPPRSRRSLRENPAVSRAAAADTGTSVDDAKQAVRDLLEALVTTIDSDTRAEGLIQALRASIQPWDEAEVRDLLLRQRERNQSAAGAGGADGSLGGGLGASGAEQAGGPSSYAYGTAHVQMGAPDQSSASTEWYQQPYTHGERQGSRSTATATGSASSALSAPAPPPLPPPLSTQSQSQLQSQPQPGTMARPSGSVPLGLDPFADLRQYIPSFAPGSSDGSTSGFGGPQLPPIGHLAAGTSAGGAGAGAHGSGSGSSAGGTGPPAGSGTGGTGAEVSGAGGSGGGSGYASTTYEFDRAVRELLAAAAMVQNQPLASGQGLGQGSFGGGAFGPYGPAQGTPSAGAGFPPPDGGGGGAQTAGYGAMPGSSSSSGSHAGFPPQQQQGAAMSVPMLSPMTLALSSLPPLTSDQQASMDWLDSLTRGF